MNQNFYQYNGYDNYSDYEFDYAHNYKNKLLSISEIKKHSTIIGCCLLAFIALVYVLVFIIGLVGADELVSNNILISECFDILYSVTGIFVPFLIASLFVKKYHKTESFGFDKPVSKRLMYLALPAGVMLCFLGDTVVSYIVTFFSMFGINMNPVEFEVPTTWSAVLMYFVSAAVVAPLVEEFAMRGVTQEPLRKYGDKFAILMTAFVFALMHQNIIQAIFAFVAGVVIGYFSIATGSVWTAVLIHFGNNFISVVTTIISDKFSQEVSTRFYYILMAVIFIVGVVSLIMFWQDDRKITLKKNDNFILTAKDKSKAFIFTIPMIIAMVVMIVNTVSYISLG